MLGRAGKAGGHSTQQLEPCRRIVILRRALQGEVLLTDEQQLSLAFVEKDVPAKSHEYAVLVTDLDAVVGAVSETTACAIGRSWLAERRTAGLSPGQTGAIQICATGSERRRQWL